MAIYVENASWTAFRLFKNSIYRKERYILEKIVKSIYIEKVYEKHLEKIKKF